MKKLVYKTGFSILLLSVALTGCKKLLDINKNPNSPTDDVINADQIIPSALHDVGINTGTLYGFLNNWMGYWSNSGSFNPDVEESSYGITNTFGPSGKYGAFYNTLFDLHKASLKAKAKNETFYVAISDIASAHLYQNLVDLFGNVPYTQVFQLQYPTPAFDDAKTIYDNLQARLDGAIAVLKTATVSTKMKQIDIMFGGNTTLWIKLANTIKLRLLLRTSEINANPSAELAKIKANGGVLQHRETAGVNPGYVNDEGKQSPFYEDYGLKPSGVEANASSRANAFAITGFKSRSDIRLQYFFNEAKSPTDKSNPYVGVIYGEPSNTAFGGDQTSNIGKGLAKSFNQPQWVITSVESLFLQAEAIYRGWDIGGPYAGNPKLAYDSAVRESFQWLGVADAANAANTYLATAVADYNTAANKLELIIKEKYYALTGFNPLESWNDYRRLGYPTNIPLSAATAREGRHIPNRLYYPAAEYAVNGKNISAQGNLDPQTAKIFWDK